MKCLLHVLARLSDCPPVLACDFPRFPWDSCSDAHALMLGAHGVDKGFPLRKLNLRNTREPLVRERTRLPNVTSVLSRRGNEYCVTCRAAPRAFALQTMKTRFSACEPFLIYTLATPTLTVRGARSVTSHRAHW